MMLRPQGYGVVSAPEGQAQEHDTMTCSHCQRIVIVKPRCPPSDAGGWCGVCAKLICKFCAGKGCTPWEKKMEQIERRERFLRSAGIGG